MINDILCNVDLKPTLQECATPTICISEYKDENQTSGYRTIQGAKTIFSLYGNNCSDYSLREFYPEFAVKYSLYYQYNMGNASDKFIAHREYSILGGRCRRLAITKRNRNNRSISDNKKYCNDTFSISSIPDGTKYHFK